MTRFDAAARWIADDHVPRQKPSGLPVPSANFDDSPQVDEKSTVDALVEAKSSALAYKANAKVIETYDAMVGALVDRSS